MPDVNPGPDVAELFAKVRTKLSWNPAKGCVGIVSPDRTVSLLGLLPSVEMPQKLIEQNKAYIPHTRPLNITAVSFTGFVAPKPDDLKRLPFVAGILPFAYIGHSIVVFEGHESGFKAALQGADVLIVDSGMLPFLRSDWFEVATGVFRDKGRVRMFDRKTMCLPPIVRSNRAPGWAYATESDGERSYVNSLLTTLCKRPPMAVQLSPNQPLPVPANLAIEPKEIEWCSELPFDYSQLDIEEVIRIIANSPGIKWSPAENGRAAGAVRMKLAEGGATARDVSFQLLSIEDGQRVRNLRIERLS